MGRQKGAYLTGSPSSAIAFMAARTVQAPCLSVYIVSMLPEPAGEGRCRRVRHFQKVERL